MPKFCSICFANSTAGYINYCRCVSLNDDLPNLPPNTPFLVSGRYLGFGEGGGGGFHGPKVTYTKRKKLKSPRICPLFLILYYICILDNISASYFLDTDDNFAFSTIFKIKWPTSEEKLYFGGRWVWVPMNPSPLPQTKLRGDAPGFRTDFVTSVWVSDAFAGVLARRDPKTPRGRPFRTPSRASGGEGPVLQLLSALGLNASSSTNRAMHDFVTKLASLSRMLGSV